MATAPAALQSPADATSGVALRLLHGWHLLSLDAATVAFCWTLLFERCVGVPRPVPAALALACAVWLIYVADRVLDAFVASDVEGPLAEVHRRYWRHFAAAAFGVGVLLCALLAAVRRDVVIAWLLLSVPLTLYGLAVHRLGLPSRWKTWSIGLFFAAAVVVPCLPVQSGPPYVLLCAALLFGEVCRQNCTLLQRRVALAPSVIACTLGGPLLLIHAAHVLPVVLACVAACGLLLWLSRERDRLHPLTFRALADAALVVPALVWLVR